MGLCLYFEAEERRGVGKIDLGRWYLGFPAFMYPRVGLRYIIRIIG